MGRKIIIKDADFSANGIFNPSWQLDYTSLAEQGNSVFCAPFEQGVAGALSMIGFNETKNKTIRFVELTLNTSNTNYNIPLKIGVYKVRYQSCELVQTFDYTITGNGQSMLLILDEPILFDDCVLGLFAYSATPYDMTSRVIICGSKNLSDSKNYVGYISGDIVFDSQGDGTTSGHYVENVGFAGYCPQARFA